MAHSGPTPEELKKAAEKEAEKERIKQLDANAAYYVASNWPITWKKLDEKEEAKVPDPLNPSALVAAVVKNPKHLESGSYACENGLVIKYDKNTHTVQRSAGIGDYKSYCDTALNMLKYSGATTITFNYTDATYVNEQDLKTVLEQARAKNLKVDFNNPGIQDFLAKRAAKYKGKEDPLVTQMHEVNAHSELMQQTVEQKRICEASTAAMEKEEKLSTKYPDPVGGPPLTDAQRGLLLTTTDVYQKTDATGASVVIVDDAGKLEAIKQQLKGIEDRLAEINKVETGLNTYFKYCEEVTPTSENIKNKTADAYLSLTDLEDQHLAGGASRLGSYQEIELVRMDLEKRVAIWKAELITIRNATQNPPLAPAIESAADLATRQATHNAAKDFLKDPGGVLKTLDDKVKAGGSLSKEMNALMTRDTGAKNDIQTLAADKRAQEQAERDRADDARRGGLALP